jgi:6-phosphogluconolactonase
VTAFTIDQATGRLDYLNHAAVRGAGPCYISLDKQSEWAFIANYGDGSVSVMKIMPDGTVETGIDSVKHQGRGEDPKRQEGPHAHSSIPAPEGKYILTADLGTNKVYVYRLERRYGILAAHESAISLTGAGPRHMVFHPAMKVLYVSNELNNTVSTYLWKPEDGKLELRQSFPTLPEDFAETSFVADVHVRPDGRFLYVSNRGHDSIAVYKIEPDGETLTIIDWVSTGGHWPRNFTISPDGKTMIVANQESASLVTFAIDEASGLPQPTGQVTEVHNPMFVKIVDL